MPHILATAPGKAILFGEHAVVYGRPAVAVPVTEVRAKATVMPLISGPAGRVEIHAPDIQLESPLADLPGEHPLKVAFHTLQAHLGLERFPALRLQVRSTIPLAAGLGSSAATSVAVLKALSEFLGRPLEKAELNRLAYEVERAHHGSPSGIDNTVITYEQPVFFRRGEPFQPLEVAAPLILLVGDTGVPGSTAEAIAGVRRLRDADPAAVEAIFDRIGRLAETARDHLLAGSVTALGPLMDANHRLLEQIGVSSAELERLVTAAREAGAYGAKLSGGGRGGNMIALVSEERLEAVRDALLAAGARRAFAARILPAVEG